MKALLQISRGRCDERGRRAASAQDTGALDKERGRRRLTSGRRPTRPMSARLSTRPTSATRTCTRRSRWTRARSARGSGRAMRTASPVARRSPPPPASRAKLSRPLDFLVVADHSDNMGFFPDLFAGKPELLADPTGRKWYDMIQSGKGAEAAIEIIVAFSHRDASRRTSCTFPARAPIAARGGRRSPPPSEYNEPGRFTAFIGYEWTSNTGGNNLHRNVIFRDNGDKASQVEPFTVYPPMGSDNPRDLWKWMAAYEKKTGGNVLAIAHNGNLSNGTHVPDHRVVHRQAGRSRSTSRRARSGSGSTKRRRPRATGETHPFLSPNDEFARLRALGQGQPRRQRRQDEGACSSSSTPARR